MEATMESIILKELREFRAENNKKLEEINQKSDETNERDILVALDTMEKSISNQFAEMEEYFDAKFAKVFSAQRLSDIEDEQFKKIIYKHEKILNFYNARLNYLEKWKEQFDLGEYTAV